MSCRFPNRRRFILFERGRHRRHHLTRFQTDNIQRDQSGAPKLKSVILRNVADAAARRLLIEQGDADIARDLGADQIASLSGKPGLVVKAVPSAQQDYVILNSANKDKPARSWTLPGRRNTVFTPSTFG